MMLPMIILMMVPDMTDDDAADAELDALCEYVVDRAETGADMRRIMQAMLEFIIANLGDDAEVIH